MSPIDQRADLEMACKATPNPLRVAASFRCEGVIGGNIRIVQMVRRTETGQARATAAYPFSTVSSSVAHRPLSTLSAQRYLPDAYPGCLGDLS